MIWLLGGYVLLYIHRPFEVWSILGDIHLERLYMLGMLFFWAFFAKKRWPVNRMSRAVILLYAVITFSWLASPFAAAGTSTFVDFCKVGVFYLLVVTTVDTEKKLRQLVIFYLAALAIYMTHSLVEFGLGRHVYRMGTIRMIGVDESYGSPNSFAATLVYSLPLLLPFFYQAKSWRNPLPWFVLGEIVLCVLLTGSRTALVGLLFVAFLVVMASPARKTALVGMVLTAPFTWFMLPDSLRNRFMTLIDPSVGPKNAQVSAESRLKLFYEALELWNQRPLTGYGPDTFGVAAGHGIKPHTLYAEVISDLGLLGIAAAAGVVAAFLLNTLQSRRLYRIYRWPRNDFLWHMSFALFVGLAVWLVLGLGGHNLYRYTWIWLGAMQVACLTCLERRVRQQRLVNRQSALAQTSLRQRSLAAAQLPAAVPAGS